MSREEDANSNSLIAAVGRSSLAARQALLFVALALGASVLGAVGTALFGRLGLLAATTAAGLCWACGAVALAIVDLNRSPSRALGAMLAGMALRMAVPLAAGFAIHSQVPQLADNGFLIFLLCSYLLTLAVETLLQVASLRTSGGDPGGPANATGPSSRAADQAAVDSHDTLRHSPALTTRTV